MKKESTPPASTLSLPPSASFRGGREQRAVNHRAPSAHARGSFPLSPSLPHHAAVAAPRSRAGGRGGADGGAQASFAVPSRSGDAAAGRGEDGAGAVREAEEGGRVRERAAAAAAPDTSAGGEA